MFLKISTIVLILGLGQITNASFFGLFRSAEPTRKPDVVVSESPKAKTDKIAYQNYLRSLASTYNTTPHPAVRYMPVYAYQPQPHLYANYIQPQQNLIYHTVNAPRILKTATIPLQYNYQPIKTNVDLPRSVKLERPITVLPLSSYDDTSVSSPRGNQDYNKLIEESSPTPSSPQINNDVSSRVKTHVFEIPEPQISATLYDLPVSGISPDFLTGGYVTKMMTVSPTDSGSTWSGQKFGHAYDNTDGTKVSEEGQLVQYGDGKENVLKRGQYQYIDANGKAVLVKWVADDNGFRLVN
ncbi:uncharacterized protein LOC129906362 [Episyrphus balteatus]|uniref:uncharacterized protein LOC129906362 n=1 Tax=Episyrphus balteatus TaxID=286459 RepID=UPI0024857EB7|nr:uncharacterized protein LOC129906362 [Episyrphus balteatus]